MSASRWIHVPLAFVAFAAPATALAQVDEGDPEGLVRQGAELSRRGELQRALEALRAAVARERSGHALAELGFVEQALGQMLEAEAHLAEALILTDERWVRHHRRDIEGALATTRAAIGSVRVTSNVEGAEVRVNGTVAGRTPLREPVRVPVGPAVVELRATGYTTASRTVNVLQGDAAEAHVSLERAGPPPPEAPPPPRCAPGLVLRGGLCFSPEPVDDGSVSPFRWMLYVGGAAAAVSAGVAIGLWANGNGDESAYLARCGGANVAPACEGDWRATQDALSSRASVVNGMWVLAGVSAATALVGLGLELRASRRRAPARAGLTIGPMGARLTW